MQTFDHTRPWWDRHGPLAWWISGCGTAIALVCVYVEPTSAPIVGPAAIASLAGMHYGRKRSRAQREANGK